MSTLGSARASRLLVSLVAFGALGLTGSASATAAPHPAVAGVLSPPDPGDPGPLAVTSTEYNDGDTAFTPPGFGHAVEVRASVHYPTGLPDGPYPLIVLLHGRHVTCHLGSEAFGGWPCTGGATTIPSFQGYDYLAENLASWGYVVISISANGVNAFDDGTADGGALARAQLIQKHLNKWKTFTTRGGSPFGSTFVGKVDLQNIGEMGHSRGGEGVVESYLLNKSLGSPYGIKAVLPLAPVDFNRHVDSNVALSVILPYCDGDVSDNQGIHFYDDALYAVAHDNTPKNSLEVMGANHNYFNTIWTPGGFEAGAFDDWGGGSDPICGSQSGSERLSAQQQRDVGLAYMAGFFRLYIGGETAMKPYFDGTKIQPDSVSFADLHTAYHAPAKQRRTVDNFMVNADLTRNLLGGSVTHKAISPFDLCGGNSPEPPTCTSAGSAQQPHTVGSAFSSKRGLSQLRFAWSSNKGLMANFIPSSRSRNVARFEAVSFRVSQNITALQNELSVTVVLTDAYGATSKVGSRKWSDALFRPLGTTGGLTPKLILNTVRIPLTEFEGVDLTRINQVTLKFNKSKVGSVLMTDLAFNS